MMAASSPNRVPCTQPSAAGGTFNATAQPGTAAPRTAHAAGPSWSRVWNHLRGGGDNYEEDRKFAADLERQIPGIAQVTQDRLRARRHLVQVLAGPERIEQLLVIGAEPPLNMPLRDEVHTIALEINPAVTTVYVAHDPMTAVYVRALTCIAGTCGWVEAAPDDPVAALSGASKLLDLSRPVAVLMTALELLDDRDAEAWFQMAGNWLPPESRLATAHLTGVGALVSTLEEICSRHQAPAPHLRNSADVAVVLGGELTELTGALHMSSQPTHGPDGGPDDLGLWCAIARIGGASHDR